MRLTAGPAGSAPADPAPATTAVINFDASGGRSTR